MKINISPIKPAKMEALNEKEKIELFELLNEKIEQLDNLTAHYKNSLEALTNAGNDPLEQRTQFEDCINSNSNRIHLFNNIIVKLNLP